MKRIGHVTIILILISCNKGQKNSNALDKRAIVQNVTQMLNDYHKDIGQKGLTAEFDYLDQSADFFWVPPGYEIALSYDSVRNILEGSAKAVRSIEFHWDTLQIFPLSNEIANYSGIVSSLMIDTAGIESKRSMIESGTIIKRENGWKLLSGQSRVLLAE